MLCVVSIFWGKREIGDASSACLLRKITNTAHILRSDIAMFVPLQNVGPETFTCVKKIRALCRSPPTVGKNVGMKVSAELYPYACSSPSHQYRK